MSNFFQSLSPIKIEKDELIFKELGSVDEVIFVCEGVYKVGFTINNRERFVVGLPFKTGEKQDPS